MLEVGNAVVSADLIDKTFCCDLEKCKGACCVLGDSGAPLEDEEAVMLKKMLPSIEPYLRPEGLKAVRQWGTSVLDIENDRVTPLVDGKECAYVIFEKGIARCGIEKAFLDGVIPFRKPLSCYLYPVRIKKYASFDAVNYDIWSVCDPARTLGEKTGVRVYEFTAPALRQKYGEAWYRQLQLDAKEILDHPPAVKKLMNK
jgi:hypothetical protein